MSPRSTSGSRKAEAAALAAAADRRRRRTVGIGVIVGLLFVAAVFGPTIVRAVQGGGAPKATVIPRDAGLPAVVVTDRQPLRFGQATAPHQVALYEDFHCSHCADLESRLGPTLYAAVADGRVRLDVWPVHFIDDGSVRAAAAFACAAQRGYGLTFHDVLFQNPLKNWSVEQLRQAAVLAHGGDDPDFDSCVGQNRYTGWVDGVTAQAKADGLVGTPRLKIDGNEVAVDQSLTPDSLKARLA